MTDTELADHVEAIAAFQKHVESRAMLLLAATRLRSDPPVDEQGVGGEERLGEALFALSDRLRAQGFLDDDANHAAYEKVVVAFQSLVSPPFGRPRKTDPRSRNITSVWRGSLQHEQSGQSSRPALFTAEAHNIWQKTAIQSRIFGWKIGKAG